MHPFIQDTNAHAGGKADAMTPAVNHFDLALEKTLDAVKNLGNMNAFDGGLKAAGCSASLVGIAFSFDSFSVSKGTRSNQRFELNGSIPFQRTLLFEYSGELYHCGYVASLFRLAMHQARQKRTSKGRDAELLRERKTSKDVEKVGHRYLNRANSENHPAQDSETDITARLVKPATVKRGDKWNEGVATETKDSRCGVVSVSFPSNSIPEQEDKP